MASIYNRGGSDGILVKTQKEQWGTGYPGNCSKNVWMMKWGTWVCGHGGGELTVELDELDDLRVLFLSEWFCDSDSSLKK